MNDIDRARNKVIGQMMLFRSRGPGVDTAECARDMQTVLAAVDEFAALVRRDALFEAAHIARWCNGDSCIDAERDILARAERWNVKGYSDRIIDGVTYRAVWSLPGEASEPDALALVLCGSVDGKRRRAMYRPMPTELYAHDPAAAVRIALDGMRHDLGADVDRFVVDEVEARSLPPGADEQEADE